MRIKLHMGYYLDPLKPPSLPKKRKKRPRHFLKGSWQAPLPNGRSGAGQAAFRRDGQARALQGRITALLGSGGAGGSRSDFSHTDPRARVASRCSGVHMHPLMCVWMHAWIHMLKCYSNACVNWCIALCTYLNAHASACINVCMNACVNVYASVLF